jgi:hypothetical protein
MPKAEIDRSDSSARVPPSAFELPRIIANVLGRRLMSYRISNYTRGERQGRSAERFPGRSIRGRRAACRWSAELR